MGDTPQYFKSPDTIKLVVGQELEELYVPRSILELIPFFNNALRGDQFKEAAEKIVRMPDDDPKAISDLLHFVFADHVKPIERVSKKTATEEETEAAKAYLRAFVVADKLMAEHTANRILDRLFDYYHSNYGTDLEMLNILRTAGLQESDPYDYLADLFAWEMRKAILKNETFRPQSAGTWHGENHLFAHMTKDDAIELLNRLSFSENKDDGKPWKKCDLHTHKMTPECPEIS